MRARRLRPWPTPTDHPSGGLAATAIRPPVYTAAHGRTARLARDPEPRPERTRGRPRVRRAHGHSTDVLHAILPRVLCLRPECDADAWLLRNRWNRERPSGPSRQIDRSRVEKASIVVVEPLSAAIARTSRAGPAGQDLPLADLTGCFVTATETPLQTGLFPCRESSKGDQS
jgi:hypothetical protein